MKRRTLSALAAGALLTTSLAAAEEARITHPTEETVPWRTPICIAAPEGSDHTLYWQVPTTQEATGKTRLTPGPDGTLRVPLDFQQNTLLLTDAEGETLDSVTTAAAPEEVTAHGGDSVLFTLSPDEEAALKQSPLDPAAYQCSFTRRGEEQPCSVVGVAELGTDNGTSEPYRLTYLLIDVSRSAIGSPKAKRDVLTHLERLNDEVETNTERDYVLGVFNNTVPDVHRVQSLDRLIETIRETNYTSGHGGASPVCKTITAALAGAYAEQQRAKARGLEPLIDVVMLSDFFDERDVSRLQRGDAWIDRQACEQAFDLSGVLDVPFYTIQVKSDVQPNFKQEELAARSGGGAYDDRHLGETLDAINDASFLRAYVALGERMGKGRITLSIGDAVLFDGIREPRSALGEYINEEEYVRGSFEQLQQEVEGYRVRAEQNAKATLNALGDGANPRVRQWLELQAQTFSALEGQPLSVFERATPLGNEHAHPKALELMRAEPDEYRHMLDRTLATLTSYTATTLLHEPAKGVGDKREQRELAELLAEEVYPYLAGHPRRTRLDRMLDVYLHPEFPADRRARSTLENIYERLVPPCGK